MFIVVIRLRSRFRWQTFLSVTNTRKEGTGSAGATRHGCCDTGAVNYSGLKSVILVLDYHGAFSADIIP